MTTIPNNTAAVLVSARDARTAHRTGAAPVGGQPCTVLCYVPANADLANIAEAAGVLGKPDAQDAAPLKGLARTSLRERYMVRVERRNAKGAALAPRYKTPLVGTVVAVQPVKAPKATTTAKAPVKGDMKVYAVDLVSRPPGTNVVQIAAQSTTSKRGKGK